MKINLFALTGFGNKAIEYLIKKNIDIKCLYTRKEKNKFPYYKEENISKVAQKYNIPLVYVDYKKSWDIKDSVDINLIVTFHRIFKKQHLKKAKFNINIHPSLLPSYKGPTPTNWMIHNKEKICGLTAHFVSSEIDSGDIISQFEYPLIATTDSKLRYFLAIKTKDIIDDITKKFPNYTIIKNNYKESYYKSYYKKD